MVIEESVVSVRCERLHMNHRIAEELALLKAAESKVLLFIVYHQDEEEVHIMMGQLFLIVEQIVTLEKYL